MQLGRDAAPQGLGVAEVRAKLRGPVQNSLLAWVGVYHYPLRKAWTGMQPKVIHLDYS